MAENFVIKTKNGEDWDILHPETNVGQVIGLQDRLETIEELPAALTAVEGRVDALETDVTTIKEDIEALETGAARTDLTNVENTTFLAKAVEAGVGGGEGANCVYVSMVEPETPVEKTVWFQTTTI